jgi:peptidoglycan/xylan/chitin deacetylase (PgdA/CDA1 family)
MPVPLHTIRSQTAPLAKTAALRLGAYAALRYLLPSRRIAILRYHAICGTEGHAYADPGICTPPAAFERHVQYLAANYSVLPLVHVVECLRTGRSLPSNCVALTFDDGYSDNLQAARILHRSGLSGTFYITAGCMAGGEPFWPAEIRSLIRAMRDDVVRLSTYRGTTEIPLQNALERQAAIRTLTRLFKAHPIPVRERLREQLRAAAGGAEVPCHMLRWEQIAEMQRLGMTIGAHTLTHPNLPRAGEADAWKEIAGSKARLERELGTPITMFSYPNGGAERYMNTAVARLVEKAGFAAATTSRNAFADADSDLFALERVEVRERVEDLAFALEVERFAFKPRPRAQEVRR